jgi:hypothetical protein
MDEKLKCLEMKWGLQEKNDLETKGSDSGELS